MVHSSLPADTDPESNRILEARWRTMSTAERVSLIDQLCADVECLARADIVSHHPDFSETEICHELARRRYGRALADAAYTEILSTG